MSRRKRTVRSPHPSLVALGLFATGLASCAGTRFSPVDAAQAHGTRTCVGKLLRIEDDAEAKIYVTLHVAPGLRGRRLLPEGQQSLPCSIFEDHRERFERLVAGLKIGQDIEVSGFHVLDRELERWALRPLTSLDPMPDDVPK